GFLGEIHPSRAKDYDIKEPYVFELDLEALLNMSDSSLGYEQIPKYPSILRDVAFVVKKDIYAGDIQQEMKRLGAPLVKSVEVFDVYTGENVQEDEKSLAFNVHYQDP